MSDIFVQNVINERDYKHLGFYVLLAIVLIFSFLVSSDFKNFSDIYLPIFFVSLFLLVGALLSKGELFGEVIYGADNNNSKIFRDITIGVMFGSVFVLAYSLFPTPIPTPNVASGPPLTQLFVAGLLSVEIEEMFRASVLVPTVIRFLKNYGEWPVIFLLIGAMSFFLFNAPTISILLFVIALVLMFNKKTKLFFGGLGSTGTQMNPRLPSPDSVRHLVAIVFTAFVFAIFHVYAYNYNLLLMEAAFAFALVADCINWYLQSTLASRVGHSIHNSFALSLQFGLYWQSIVIVLVYVLLILSSSGSLDIKSFLEGEEKRQSS